MGIVAILLVLSGLVSACQAVDLSAGTEDRTQLANDLAGRLDQASQKIYTAQYQLSGGELSTLVQGQRPYRFAYSFPGGQYVLTPEAEMICTIRENAGQSHCEIFPPPTPSLTTDLRSLAEAGFLPPDAVVDLLTATSLDPEAQIEYSDTTIAGRHATCLSVSGLRDAAAANFQTCVTTEGLLASFSGTVNIDLLVGDTNDDTDSGVETTWVDLLLTQQSDTISPDAFDPPADAVVVDNRPSASRS